MKTKLHFVLILVFSMALNACVNQTTSNNKKLSFLKVHGQYFVNESSDTVFLKSIGLGNWLLPEGYMWKFDPKGDRPRKIEQVVEELIGKKQARQFWRSYRANYITENDIIRIKELGFNSVRPALNARLFISETEPYVFLEEGFILLNNLVQWCKKHKLYVIIDMHAAPGGQTGANIDDSKNNQPELFIDSKNQDALVKLWVEIANRYKNEPTIAAYDLLNEPLPDNTGAADKYRHLVEPLYQRISTEIRKVDTKHMITLEGTNWANDWSIFSEPFDTNTFYQFHYYCWDRPVQLKSINYYLTERERLNTPIWVGETGESTLDIFWATTQYFELNNVNWSFWPWKKMDTKNTPYSIKKPNNWDFIIEYTKGGEKPDEKLAQKAFNTYLENIKLSNCEYFEKVTKAIFRNIPGKIEAENYMPGSYNETWFIHDTTKTASHYRTSEFVPIQLLAVDSTSNKWRWYSEQAVYLQKGEWLTYQANRNNAMEKTKVRMQVKTSNPPSKILFSSNNKFVIVEFNNTNLKPVYIGEVATLKGTNNFKIKVIKGDATIDWIEFK